MAIQNERNYVVDVKENNGTVIAGDNNNCYITCTFTGSVRGLDQNNPLELSRVFTCQPELETPFQAFLTKSQNILKAEGSYIRIFTKVCDNGKKVQIKVRFDVRSSVKRRSKSLTNLLLLPECREKSHSFSNLSRTDSSITILNEEVNVHESNESVQRLPATIVQEADAEEQVKQVQVDGFNLENRNIFAKGKFGPLYKVCRKGREQLVKTVKTCTENEHFLKEAKQFCKCRHPYIRPTADILEEEGRSLVFYWFLPGTLSLFEAIENSVINNYLVFCRILFGMVKGLDYLRRTGIQCEFLSPEKVLLDSRFNPRISGVGMAYFESCKDTETNDASFHRSLSYLDNSLRSREEKHPKNVLWSVGQCIWDMLLGRTCHKWDHEDEDILSKYDILGHLQEPCDDKKIKSVYFSPELRRIVYGAGWPKDKEITKSLVVCAVRCMLFNLEERMSLQSLYNTLEAEWCELQKKVKIPLTLYEFSDNLCLYCIKNERDDLRLTCGCNTACIDCLRNNGQLDCPEHGTQFSKIGHPLTYGVLIQGKFHEDESLCTNDSLEMESLLTDQSIFALKNFEHVKSKGEKEACAELKKIKTKIIKDMKSRDGEKYPSTLILYITGHCNKSGNLILNDGTILKKKILNEVIYDTNPKYLIVFANGHYSEKLVHNLSRARTNLFSSGKFFGVFSHAGNMCHMSHRDVSDKNSIFVRYLLDILKQDQLKDTCSTERVQTKRYLTVQGLTTEISRRTQEKFNKCLKPIEQDNGGHIPIVYI